MRTFTRTALTAAMATTLSLGANAQVNPTEKDRDILSREYTGKVYGDYLQDAQRFAWALFDVYLEGDGQGLLTLCRARLRHQCLFR